MNREEEINIDDFFHLTSRNEVAEFLGGSLKNLAYNLYVIPDEEKYKLFSIPKKTGGTREICAPISSIKFYQRNLADVLLNIYNTKVCVHGYARGKSIKTNAAVHRGKRWVVNLDLKNFFPSIHFGRVRGVFKSKPFEFSDEVATTLAKICCYKAVLPQGSPSSPVISNYVCRSLDNSLHAFAIRNKLLYTRYADDITFSTNLKELPEALGVITADATLQLSEELLKIITTNHFEVNEAKLHYALKNNRQEVTGLVVNEKVNVKRTYIRQIRAMLHAWQKYGLDNAAEMYFKKYTTKPMPDYPDLLFSKVVAGRIGFVGQIKGADDQVYRNLYGRLKQLDPLLKLAMPKYIHVEDKDTVIVMCEGKTDGLHLTKALEYFVEKGEFLDMNVTFYKYPDEKSINNSILLHYCHSAALEKREHITICLFDNDAKDCGPAKILENGHEYKYWGGNLYSCLLPQPEHRNFKEVCIEHFYSDEDLKRENKKGRRIYLSNEFNPENNKHYKSSLIYNNKNVLKSHYPKIIDSGVYKDNGDNAALSKNDFANSILHETEGFKGVSFEYFRPIFEMLQRIITIAQADGTRCQRP